MFKFKVTIPKVQIDWWKASKKEVTEIVKKYQKESWQAEKDPVTGAKWKPRKPPTGSWPILRKTGKMQDTTKIKPPSSPMKFIARTGVDYGKFHMTGTSRMPQRRWLGIGPKAIREIEAVIAKNIFKGKITYSS